MWTSCPQACITPTVAPRASSRANFRRVRQPGLLGDRQRVHVGPQHEHLAGAVLQHADDAVAADVRSSPSRRRRAAPCAMRAAVSFSCSDSSGRLVQVLIQLDERRHVVRHPRGGIGRARRHRERGTPKLAQIATTMAKLRRIAIAQHRDPKSAIRNRNRLARIARRHYLLRIHFSLSH